MTDTTPRTISLLSPGAMGSAVAARFTAAGIRVLTSLDGRSPASIERARQAGMTHASDAELAAAEMIVSIVPPSDARALVERLAPHIAARTTKPLYIDANAVNPQTKHALAETLAGIGCDMVDGAIIGIPPAEGRPPANLLLSGAHAARAAALDVPGIRARIVEGDIGAASVIKMCFAGINKGVVGLATAMMLAAERHGAADALRKEMIESMPDLFARFTRQVPDSFGKAYRWIGEMREISEFLDTDAAGAAVYEGMAGVFGRIAADMDGEQRDVAALRHAVSRD